MEITKYIKTIFLFLLTFVLGAQTIYAKTELVLPVQSIGFLKEKTKFVKSEGVSTQNQHEFTEKNLRELAEGVDDVLAKLLKNNDFKAIYDDLVNGTVTRKFPNELSIQEEAIYKFYTNDSYFNFNEALIQGNKTEDIIELEILLNNTINKLPSSPGTYYRGIGKGEIDKLSTYNIGDVIHYENFLSSSKESSVAGSFARKNKIKTGEGALIEIRSVNGKDIKRYSDADFEEEILHQSGSTFILHSIQNNQLLNAFEVSVDGLPPVYGRRYILIEQ